MSFFDSGLVHFIKLLIIIGLIGMLYMIVMQKIKEQNHKISSLLSLVTTMAHEITTLKETHKEVHEDVETFLPLEEKDEISDDSDDSDDSDSDSESIDLEEIDLTKGDKITMMESEIEPEILEPISSDVVEDVLEMDPVVENEVNIKKMNITQLIDLVVSKGLKTKTDAKKLKKNDLIQLLE